MSTQSISIHSPERDLIRRPAVASDRADAARQARGARILRRWSVSELIARAGGAPRAFA
jgi:hypothetical protein